MCNDLLKYLPSPELMPDKLFTLPELRYPRQMNLTDFFLDPNLKKHPDKVAILFNDQKITYRELNQEVNQLANGLLNLGIKLYDRVLLRTYNIPMAVIANFACWRIGAIPVLINPAQRCEEIVYRANDTEACGIIVQDVLTEEVEKVRSEMPAMRHYLIVGGRNEGYINVADLMNGQPAEIVSADTTVDDIGRITYSSGSTGKPKGVVSTFSDMLAATDTHGRYLLKIQEDDIIGGHPALTFAYGSLNFNLEPWRFGATLSLVEKATPQEMFNTVEKHGITILCCVPTFFRMMLSVKDADKYDLSSVRLGHSASENLPYTTRKEWKDRFSIEILDCLGSSELMYTLATPEGMPESKYGSTGFPIHGIEAKIVDENFNEVARGKVGELVFRGPFGTVYWNRPDKQRELVKNGWSRLGISFMEDEDGYFWYMGRLDDLIVSSGYKIPGGEVELAINSHPQVLESVVIGVPDPIRGNIVQAYVVLKDHSKASPELKAEIQEHVKQKIEPYKYPREVKFLLAKELPRTSTGKIQRHRVKDIDSTL